jgi:hypothetical protein
VFQFMISMSKLIEVDVIDVQRMPSSNAGVSNTTFV